MTIEDNWSRRISRRTFLTGAAGAVAGADVDGPVGGPDLTGSGE